MIRLCGDHVYAVVQVKDKPEMPRIYHNGLDVETPQEVDEAYRTVLANQETWGLHKAPGRSPSTAPTASCSGTSTFNLRLARLMFRRRVLDLPTVKDSWLCFVVFHVSVPRLARTKHFRVWLVVGPHTGLIRREVNVQPGRQQDCGT